MIRPTFLDNPSAHTRTQRTTSTSTDYACAIETHRDDTGQTVVMVVGVALLIILATLMYTGVLS